MSDASTSLAPHDNNNRHPDTPQRMTFPDGLRAIAAMMVVLPHSVGFFAYWPSPTLPTRWVIAACHYGIYGVQIFFVLSGFVIAYTLRRDRITAPFFGRFVLRRSLRLDPPYWAAIFFMLGVLALQSRHGNGAVNWPTASDLIAHLFYMQDLLGRPQIIIVFWTLCIEVQFYLVFCLVLWTAQRIGRFGLKSAWVVYGLLLVSLLWPIGLVPGAGAWFLPHWYGFLAGAVAWYVVEGAIRAWPLVIIAVALLAAGVFNRNPAPAFVACATLSILICWSREGLYRWMSWKAVKWLAAVSYCLYLVHVPIHVVLLGTFVRLAPRSEWASYAALLVSIVLYLVVAFLLHRAVEAPALRFSAKLKRHPRDTPQPLVAAAT